MLSFAVKLSIYWCYAHVILLILYIHMLLLCLGPASQGLLCRISAFCSSHQHTEAIFKYPFGLYTLDIPSDWSFTAQISCFSLHWDPHHAWGSQRADTYIYSTYMSTYEALPTIYIPAWFSSESDQLHWFQQPHFFIMGIRVIADYIGDISVISFISAS